MTDSKIAAAMRQAHYTHPYYTPAMSRLRIVPDAAVATMSTSASWVTHYNPTTVAGWTVDETAAVLVHELEHLLRDHHGRMGDRDPKGWNIAGDAEINQRLEGLPDGCVYPETLGMPRGMGAETYYNGAGKGDDGDGGKPGDGKPGDSGKGDCGSAAGGPVQEHEKGDAANPGAGAYDPDAVRQEVAEGILAGRGAGDELREWAETAIGIDRAGWYTALATIVGKVAAPYGAPTRYRWPGRREMGDMGGAMVPRWVGERPSIAVVIDTSSSVTPGDLDMARDAGHFIKRVADCNFYACDDYPTPLGKVMPDRLRGNGGTDMRKGIEMAIRDGARGVVVITDCYTPWPDTDPGVPVIVAANLGSRPVINGGPDGVQYGAHYYPPEWMTVLPLVTPAD